MAPSITAAFATAAATAGATVWSNTEGTTKFGVSSFSSTVAAMACARRDLHRLGDAVGTDIEGTAEDAGERQHIVDLVREVTPAGGHDRSEPIGRLGTNLRIGIGHGETIGFGAILRRSLASIRSGADTPMKMSAPSSTSWSVPALRSGLVWSANHSFAKFSRSRPE